jgi:hypothetical protein
MIMLWVRETGKHSQEQINVAKSSEEGYGSRRAMLSMMIMI